MIESGDGPGEAASYVRAGGESGKIDSLPKRIFCKNVRRTRAIAGAQFSKGRIPG
jgi:hypothetical protein